MRNPNSGLPLFICVLFACVAFTNPTHAQKREYYEIKVYRLTANEQVKKVNDFLQNAYLPALHRAGIGKTGVYHPIGNDTAIEKRIYVFIPLRSLEQVNTIEDMMLKDPVLAQAGESYWSAAYNESPFKRIESIVLKAFAMMPKMQVPSLIGKKTERIYELRSYEAATERLYRKKVEMFNEGGEIALFNRLQFNAVFYGEVLAGSHMPNLMYMTSFNNRAERDEHWKTFGADPEWKKLSALPEYKNTVSKNDPVLLNPAEFSEL